MIIYQITTSIIEQIATVLSLLEMAAMSLFPVTTSYRPNFKCQIW